MDVGQWTLDALDGVRGSPQAITRAAYVPGRSKAKKMKSRSPGE